MQNNSKNILTHDSNEFISYFKTNDLSLKMYKQTKLPYLTKQKIESNSQTV